MKQKKGSEFAQRLEKRRLELGYSQRGLCRKAVIPSTTIRVYESGSYPRGNNAVLLAKALGCSLDWLLMGVGSAPENPFGFKKDNLAESEPIEINIDIPEKSLQKMIEAFQKIEKETSIMATNLTKGLQTVSNDINKLSQRIEKLIAAMGEPAKSSPAKAKPVKKPTVKLTKKTATKKESKLPANLVVLEIIEKSEQAVDMATLKEKSGFQGQKLYNVLSSLKKQGKVKNPNKGFYLKA